jgi:nucleotide-binding universal stress UspA family protein
MTISLHFTDTFFGLQYIMRIGRILKYGILDSPQRNPFIRKYPSRPPVLFMKEYQKILIPVDGSEPAKYAALRGLSLAKLIGAEVTAVHVIEHPHFLGEALAVGDMIPVEPPEMKESDMFQGLKKMAQEAVHFVKEEGEKQGVEVKTKIMEGHAADQIVKLSEEYDLIVISALGRSCVTDLLMGGVADKVARHAKCPILLVRERKE